MLAQRASKVFLEAWGQQAQQVRRAFLGLSVQPVPRATQALADYLVQQVVRDLLAPPAPQVLPVLSER